MEATDIKRKLNNEPEITKSMKLITNSILIAAIVAVFAVSARADDQQLANRLAIAHAQASKAVTTVAVFSSRQGLGSSVAQAAPAKQLGQLNDGHGHTIALFR
jgi:hypothetical protein